MTKPRTTRDEETRDHELAGDYNFQPLHPFDLPEGVYKEGYDFHWARLSIRGERDHRVEEMVSKGWKLVPGSRAPNRYIDPLSENSLSKDYIIKKDTILMERPSIYSKREKEYLQKVSEQRTRALPGMSRETSEIGVRSQYSNYF
jgi:hypothetical protein